MRVFFFESLHFIFNIKMRSDAVCIFQSFFDILRHNHLITHISVYLPACDEDALRNIKEEVVQEIVVLYIANFLKSEKTGANRTATVIASNPRRDRCQSSNNSYGWPCAENPVPVERF